MTNPKNSINSEIFKYENLPEDAKQRIENSPYIKNKKIGKTKRFYLLFRLLFYI